MTSPPRSSSSAKQRRMGGREMNEVYICVSRSAKTLAIVIQHRTKHHTALEQRSTPTARKQTPDRRHPIRTRRRKKELDRAGPVQPASKYANFASKREGWWAGPSPCSSQHQWARDRTNTQLERGHQERASHSARENSLGRRCTNAPIE